MKFKEYTIKTTDAAEELIADIFWNYTDFGVAVSSLKDVIELTEKRRETYDYIEKSAYSGNEGVSFVKGYFSLDTYIDDIRAVNSDIDALKVRAKGIIDLGSLETSVRTVDGENWIEIWRKHFKPIEFSSITVCPEWVDYDGNKPVVYIGSNMAFGTGEHETTSMCIEFLQNYVQKGFTVIDVGTGSGILGIAAAKLGAEKVYMTDNDSKAVEAAKYNVKINKVESLCYPTLANLLDGVNVKGDVVVANITAEILAVLSDTISDFVKAGSVVVMSGILNDRVNTVLDTYLPLGFKLLESKCTGEWTALALRRSK